MMETPDAEKGNADCVRAFLLPTDARKKSLPRPCRRGNDSTVERRDAGRRVIGLAVGC